MNDALLKALKRLRLSGLAQTLDVRLQETAGHNLNHAEFLELILQDELAIREDRLLARRVRAADFREPKTLEDFDWQFNTPSNASRCTTWLRASPGLTLSPWSHKARTARVRLICDS